MGRTKTWGGTFGRWPVWLAALSFGVGLWLIRGLVDRAGLPQIRTDLAAIAPWRWGAALALTWASFLAIGRFDAGLHRWLDTGVAPVPAARAGRAAVALAQTLGAGSVTGALVRWRLLPGLDPWSAARLSLVASLGFLAALAALFGLAGAAATGQGALLTGIVVASIWLVRRDATLARALRLGLWVAADTACATAVIWVLWPGGPGVSAAHFLAAYLAALGLGLVSASPGGVGLFEVTLTAFLPDAGTSALIAAILGYRLVYHLLPALWGLACLLRTAAAPAPLAALPAARAEAAIAAAPDPEWALSRQGGVILADTGLRRGWHARPLPTTLVLLGPPLGAAPGRKDFADLVRTAAVTGRAPLLYKCDARIATRARRAGWRVLRIASEGRLDPAGWRPKGPAHRQLRRRLRSAAAAGLRFDAAPGDLPLVEMARLAAGWAARHGGERGVSMGRYCPDLLRHSRVVLGWQGTRLAGFVSFHATPAGWTLDLLRADSDAPAGTMHALVAAGIGRAAAEGATMVSLAAISRLPGNLCPDPGLARFKQCFAPDWHPRYAAAPGTVALLLGLVRIALAIRRPPPVAAASRFGFESPALTCDAQRDKARGMPPGAAVTCAVQTRTMTPHDRRPFPPP